VSELSDQADVAAGGGCNLTWRGPGGRCIPRVVPPGLDWRIGCRAFLGHPSWESACPA